MTLFELTAAASDSGGMGAAEAVDAAKPTTKAAAPLTARVECVHRIRIAVPARTGKLIARHRNDYVTVAITQREREGLADLLHAGNAHKEPR
jgi:hypothetical protein